jgi:O-antigen biosynthesis protein WbqP
MPRHFRSSFNESSPKLMYAGGLKRVIDVVGAIAALMILSPVLLIFGVLVKLTDPGPVIFRQTRIGVAGRPFTFYKFRSMPVGTGHVPSDQLGEVRLSAVGRLIRRTNIDELPQLFNILKGDMSFVGPRPPLSSQTDLLGLRDANGALRCRPGLTGLAQVSSFDGMSVERKAEFDGQYARQVTLLNDVIIVMRTFGYLLKPPPRY